MRLAWLLLLASVLFSHGCIKPRRYVLAHRKPYIIAEATVIPVIVDDKELGKSVVVEFEFQPGDKVARVGGAK